MSIRAYSLTYCPSEPSCPLTTVEFPRPTVRSTSCILGTLRFLSTSGIANTGHVRILYGASDLNAVPTPSGLPLVLFNADLTVGLTAAFRWHLLQTTAFPLNSSKQAIGLVVQWLSTSSICWEAATSETSTVFPRGRPAEAEPGDWKTSVRLRVRPYVLALLPSIGRSVECSRDRAAFAATSPRTGAIPAHTSEYIQRLARRQCCRIWSRGAVV